MSRTSFYCGSLRVGLVGVLLLVVSPFLTAQDSGRDHDVGIWVNADVAPKALGGKWQPLFSLEYRGKDNLRKIDLFSGLVLMDYIVNKHLTIGAGYEIYLNKMPDGGYGFEHRIYPEVILRSSLSAFSASLRVRVFDNFVRISNPYWASRIRLKLNCQIKSLPLKPYISAEPYHHIIHPFQYRINKIRYITGCAYTIPHHQFDLYYLAEHYHDKPFVRHVLGISYCYSF